MARCCNFSSSSRHDAEKSNISGAEKSRKEVDKNGDKCSNRGFLVSGLILLILLASTAAILYSFNFPPFEKYSEIKKPPNTPKVDKISKPKDTPTVIGAKTIPVYHSPTDRYFTPNKKLPKGYETPKSPKFIKIKLGDNGGSAHPKLYSPGFKNNDSTELVKLAWLNSLAQKAKMEQIKDTVAKAKEFLLTKTVNELNEELVAPVLESVIPLPLTSDDYSLSKHPAPSSPTSPKMHALITASKYVSPNKSTLNSEFVALWKDFLDLIPVSEADPWTGIAVIQDFSDSDNNIKISEIQTAGGKRMLRRISVLSDNLTYVAALVKSALIIMKLNTAYFVQIFDIKHLIIENNNEIWMIYEETKGVSLQELKEQKIESGNSWTEDELKWTLYELGKCLKELHSKGLNLKEIHARDITVTSQKTIKLTHMGIVTDQSGSIMVSPNSSPEILLAIEEDLKHSNSIDMWNIGLLLFELENGPSEVSSFTSVDEGREFWTHGNALVDTADASDFSRILAPILSKDAIQRPTANELIDLPYFNNLRVVEFTLKKNKLSAAELIPYIRDPTQFSANSGEPWAAWGDNDNVFLYHLSLPEYSGRHYPVWFFEEEQEQRRDVLVPLCEKLSASPHFFELMADFVDKDSKGVVFNEFSGYLLSDVVALRNINERFVCEIAFQLLEALRYLSEAKILHQNLNLNTIYLTTDGRVVLGHYGNLIEHQQDGIINKYYSQHNTEYIHSIHYRNFGSTPYGDLFAVGQIVALLIEPNRKKLWREHADFVSRITRANCSLQDAISDSFLKGRQPFVVENGLLFPKYETFTERDLVANIRDRLYPYTTSPDWLASVKFVSSLVIDEIGSLDKYYKEIDGTFFAVRKISIVPHLNVEQLIADLVLIKSLYHPNIANFVGAHVLQHEFWIVYEMVSEHPLSETQKLKCAKTIRFVLYEMLKGLSYLNSKGIYHGRLSLKYAQFGTDTLLKIMDPMILNEFTNSLQKVHDESSHIIAPSMVNDLNAFAGIVRFYHPSSMQEVNEFVSFLCQNKTFEEIEDHEFMADVKKYYSSFYSLIDMAAKRAPFGSLFLDKFLGKGQFGSVYKVWDHKDPSREYALKQIQFKTASNLMVTSGLNHELISLRECQGPNIVEFHELFYSHDSFWIMMNIYDDGDLTVFRKHKAVMTSELLRQITWQMLKGLSLMHQRDYGHYDIKPANVLIDLNTNYVVLADFGLATKGTQNNYKGSPAFMAPEVYVTKTDANAVFDKAADVWSLGVTIYNIWTDDLFPVHGKNVEEFVLNALAYNGSLLILPREDANIRRFLGKTIVGDLSKRATVAELMLDSWFDDLRNPNATPPSSPLIKETDFSDPKYAWGTFEGSRGFKLILSDKTEELIDDWSDPRGQKIDITGERSPESAEYIEKLAHIKLWWLFQGLRGNTKALKGLCSRIGLSSVTDLKAVLELAYTRFVLPAIKQEIAYLSDAMFMMVATLSDSHPKTFKVSTLHHFGFQVFKFVKNSAEQLYQLTRKGQDLLKERGLQFYLPGQ